MSTAFTPPANATWQTLLNELTLAYSERRQAVGSAAYTATDDRDVQAAAYWAAMQGWIQSNCGLFIDWVNGPTNPRAYDPYFWGLFLGFSLSAFRAAAGLNALGFRRVPEGVEWDGETDPEWSYGVMQAGDTIGPWIFEDLQKAFSALRWTSVALDFEKITRQRKEATSTCWGICKIDKAELAASWAAASWVPTDYLYSIEAQHYFYGSHRVKSSGPWPSNSIPTMRPCTSDLYLHVLPADPDNYEVFQDIDGIGLAEGSQLFESQGASSDAIRYYVAGGMGNYATEPTAAAGLTCPSQPKLYVAKIPTAAVLLKWDFTYV